MRKISLSNLALFLTLAGGLLASSSLGCGPGKVHGSEDVVEERREVSGFNEVHLKGIGNLKIEMGDEESLRIRAQENLLPYIKTKVRGHTLIIEFEWGVKPEPTEPIDYYLTAKELNDISISGSGNVEVSELETEEFSLRLNGSSDAHIAKLVGRSVEITINGQGEIDIETLHTESLDANIRGSGKMSIGAGKAEEQNVSIAGSGTYKAREMESARANVHIAGSASVVLSATDRLKVRIVGSGSVKYGGTPEVDVRIGGSGTVKRIEE